MPDTSFKIGDVVVRKSGSPRMTVGRILEDGDLKCFWFADTDVKSYVFEARALQRTEAPESPVW